jgi:hypothetical protein
MFILKLAIVTGAVYMGISIFLFFGIIALAHLKGSIFYDLNWRGFRLLFALICWFVSRWHGASSFPLWLPVKYCEPSYPV